MIKFLLAIICLSLITSKRFLEEKIDFTVKVDFQGLKHCMNQNVLENELNKKLIERINNKEYAEASILYYVQLRKGNNIVKKCKEYLPQIGTLEKIYSSMCHIYTTTRAFLPPN